MIRCNLNAMNLIFENSKVRQPLYITKPFEWLAHNTSSYIFSHIKFLILFFMFLHILLQIGVASRGGGGEEEGQFPPYDFIFVLVSAQGSVMLVDDENIPTPLWKFATNNFSGRNKMCRSRPAPPPRPQHRSTGGAVSRHFATPTQTPGTLAPSLIIMANVSNCQKLIYRVLQWNFIPSQVFQLPCGVQYLD